MADPIVLRRVTRRGFMRTVSGSIAAASLSGCLTAPKRAAQRPNVVFVFSDQHRWQSMSFTEQPLAHTPHMARLASQGLEFTHCISNYPVCSLYRAMLMTGCWPYQTGIIDNGIHLRSDEMTIGRTLQAAGYTTAYIGKWHLGGTRAESFGFDLSLIWSNTNAHWDKSVYHPKGRRPVRPTGYNATLMTDQALAFVEQHRDGQNPFFVMLSLNPPHANFHDAPKEKQELYPQGIAPPRENAPNAPEFREKAYKGYLSHISAIDDELGRIMAKLDELGLSENTILVYTSDHGSMMGSHGLGGKRQPYEESIRVPFLIKWPGVIPAKRKIDALFGAIDIMPTMCGIAGAQIPRTCEGLDFSPWLRDERGPNPDSQFIMHISKKHAGGGDNHPAPLFRGLRTKRYTYAVYPDKRWCLFDNEKDPYQLDNLIDDPDKAGLVEELGRTLTEWMRKAEDPLELPHS